MRDSALGGLRQRTEAEILASQYGVIAREQALGLGMTPKMVRGRLGSGRWIGVHAAVYRSAEAPFGWHGRLMAACLALGPRAVVSHRAAAALWGLDGCEEGLVELTLGGVGERRLRGVRMHRTRSLPVADRTQRDGLPITRVARTLIDLAAVVEEEPLEAALDSALREGLISVAHLDRRLGALGSKGRRGAERLRRLVDERRGDARPADSRRENRLVRHLEAAGLPRPVKQFELRDEGGLIARFDLAYPDARIGGTSPGTIGRRPQAGWCSISPSTTTSVPLCRP